MLPVVLFGYESSTFTLKVRLALRLKQIDYIYVAVPSMMPRPVLVETFGLTYRKIPVLAIGRDVYCDTSIICEALEHNFPTSQGYGTLYPVAEDGRKYRAMIRGFASYWTDRPLFRATTGLIPASVWRTAFGRDRAQLIGHPLDAEKLEKKIPENMERLDLQLSMFEEAFAETTQDWLLPTSGPSLADISLWYQLKWGIDISKGQQIHNLTGGGTADTTTAGADAVFNVERYPRLLSWFKRFGEYIDALPVVESTRKMDTVINELNTCSTQIDLLLPTPQAAHTSLGQACGLVQGAEVSVVPDDTGRANPTVGTLLALSPEEVVIHPQPLEPVPRVLARLHFPRLGFVVRPTSTARL